jgi:hypothetical protein
LYFATLLKEKLLAFVPFCGDETRTAIFKLCSVTVLVTNFLAYYEAFRFISMFMTARCSVVLTWMDPIHVLTPHLLEMLTTVAVLKSFGLWNTKIVVTNPILGMHVCSFTVFALYLPCDGPITRPRNSTQCTQRLFEKLEKKKS